MYFGSFEEIKLENVSNMSGNTSQSNQSKTSFLWINQISEDDNRKGAYKVDKNKPSRLISLAPSKGT